MKLKALNTFFLLLSTTLISLAQSADMHNFVSPLKAIRSPNEESKPTICTGGATCSFTRPGSELVMDGSFELNKCCPQSLGELYSNTSSACFWDNPSSTSSDYYHSCGSKVAGVPNNYANNNSSGVIPQALQGPVYAFAQNSRSLTGNAYAGIIAGGPAATDFNEYIRQSLSATLINGKRYYAEFSVYLAPLSGFTIPELGISIADNSYISSWQSNGAPVPVAQVSGNPNLPSSGWKRIGGSFVASTSPSLTNLTNPDLVVGNFASGQAVQNGPNQFIPADPYYYIDNVSLSPLTEAGPAYTTTTCNQVAAFILGTAPMPNVVDAHYQWSAAPADASLSTAAAQTANPQVSPNRTTTYTLTVTINGQNYTSNTTVTVNYGSATAGQDKLICAGQSATLGEGCSVPGATYTWSAFGVSNLPTNSQNIQLVQSPSTTTTYTLTVNLPDGTSTQSTVTVTVEQSIASAPGIGLAPWPIACSFCAQEFDVRVDNTIGATSFRLINELQGNNGNWYPGGGPPLTVNAYTGLDDFGRNEAAGFTTFHMHLPGPPPSTHSTSPGNTYRFTVTAFGACNSIVGQEVITIPAYGGNGEESSITSPNSPSTAYPNPAAESITIPEGAEGATLISDKGKTLRKADASGKLDVQSLPDGLYNLQIMQDGKLINQRIQVKH